jgi:hypothetical protein
MHTSAIRVGDSIATNSGRTDHSRGLRVAHRVIVAFVHGAALAGVPADDLGAVRTLQRGSPRTGQAEINRIDLSMKTAIVTSELNVSTIRPSNRRW